MSRNLFFYNKIGLKDTFETRIYLMFFHFSLMLIIFKYKKIKFPQKSYDDLFFCIENNLRELGYGDVGVNKKMKDLNKILYDILLKLHKYKSDFKINKNIVLRYFVEFNITNETKYSYFDQYLTNFYHFCFELSPDNMIKEAINFRN